MKRLETARACISAFIAEQINGPSLDNRQMEILARLRLIVHEIAEQEFAWEKRGTFPEVILEKLRRMP